MTDSTEPPALPDFDIGSSTLLHSAPSNDGSVTHTTPKVVSKFDPVAQLMESDSETSDTDVWKSVCAPSPRLDTHADSGIDEKPRRKRKPMSQARFVQKKGSVMRQLGLRCRAIDSDSSSSDSDSNTAKPGRSRVAKAITPDADSESDTNPEVNPNSNTTKPGRSRVAKAITPDKENSDSESDTNPEVNSNSIIAEPKPRMASAAALARIHQESERLIRETAVHLDPLDFTNRLILSDFYLKFDSHSTPKPTRAPFVMPPLKISGSFAFGEGDDQVMVLDPCDEIAFGSQRVRNVTSTLVGGNALDAILARGSQSMHVEGGSLALKDLNSALLDVMHEKDRADRAEKEEKAAQKLKNKIERSQNVQVDERVDSDDEPVDADALLDAVAEDTDEDTDIEENVESGSDDSGSEIEDNANTEPVVRGKNRAAVTSDEESGTEDAAPIAPARAKSQFVGMFRMPVREVPLPQNGPHKERSPAPVRATPSQDMASQGPESQVMQDLFSSQSGCINTQDSLLMTPDMATQRFGNGGDEYGLEFATQPTQMEQVTQPTQMEQVTQPTQPTQPTQLTASSGEADVSMLPTMVRRALGADPVQSEDDEEEKSRGSTPAEHITLANQMEPTDDLIEPTEDLIDTPEPRHRGRLLRRNQTSSTKPKRPKRSEFVEAEAEEGSSSDSDNEKTKSRKFNWGSNERTNESDESDYDMDSDEEQAALLADPMIDNTENSDMEGDAAIRLLHRKQHYEDDERDIHELFRDVTTGGLRTRRTKFSLGEDEDYNDRQTRAERMEQRAREMNKLRMREIHDTSLAEIAKHPETAAFARAALMRGDDTDDDGGVDDVGELEEVVADHAVAATVRSRLIRRVSSRDSDSESGADSRNVHSVDMPSSASGNVSDTKDGNVFGSVPIEQMIIRRKTLRAVDTSTTKSSSVWKPRPPLPHAPMKRTGASMTANNVKRLNTGGK
ncbi:hypothetical protein GGH12_000734 [Coemansia sp. RSA 1822]|nr:hypothetical protein LPJ76_004678 [Coemansia sp. RSA 638]KAJ2544958.1 hypothetical protein GGF49_000868 [Coemansia sp. RSA 1853]KAJ2566580.1 hypothetical protein GGH12_000734 [Coemansia sp. RSA 1822]